MARIPQDVIDRLKTETSLVRLVEHYGIELKKQGKDLAGRCPFHEDDTPSLIISERKNVFHCFGCNASGTVIDWIMKIEGISFRHAVELLQQGVSSLASQPNPVKRSVRRKLDAPFAHDANDQALLNRVIDFYHRTLLQSPDALEYLDKRGLNDCALIERFKLGYANRTLTYRLPPKTNREGQALRGQLQRLGVLRASGHEHFNGSLVIPVLDDQGNVMQAYGRKIRDDLRKGTPKHLYLPGPHRGVFNLDGLKDTEEVILCEALIDALTFWHAGYKNVTSSYGVNGFTDELLAALKAHPIKRVLIAYDRDVSGAAGAKALAERLNREGFDCYRILFPKSMDANAYALSVQPASKSLGAVIRSAEWMNGAGGVRELEAGDQGQETGSTQQETSETESPAKQRFEQQLKTVAEQVKAIEQAPAMESLPAPVEPDMPSSESPLPASPVPSLPVDVPAEIAEVAPGVLPPATLAHPCAAHEVTFTFGDRYYRVRGLEKNVSYEQLKINLLASRDGVVHVDTLDLYSARHRQSFIQHAATELGADARVIKTDVGKVLLKCEALQEHRIRARLEAESEKKPALTDDEQQDALTLLKSPDLLNRIVHDVERCGLVGEKNNSLAGYLACVSRKLDGPLAIIVQSTSAAGKSSLMDAVLAMMPEEDRVQYSAMTGQSLFYMGETNLKHKILAIAEEEGAAQASYALKLLQSEGELTIASTAKDPQSGRLETQEYRVEGPVMLFLTTTAIEIDDELLNRCLVLTVNEDREQTQAIHQLQRKKRTLDGLLLKQEKKNVLALHRNAQRLLKPLHVVNPFAEQLTFLDDKTRTRRDHEKYLTLIDSIALLHQYQRKTQTVTANGERIEYIEVTREDIAVANRLAHDILGRTLDELPPQTRRLLKLIHAMVQAQCQAQGIEQRDFRFNRRDIREYSHWSDTALKIHLSRLVDLEYILAHRGRRGNAHEYELLYHGEGEQGEAFLCGLIDVDTLHYDKNRSGQNGKRSGSGQGAVSPRSGHGPGKQNGKTESASMTYPVEPQNTPKTAYTVQENGLVVT